MGWTARWRRGLVSAFVLWHLGATAVWVLPECPIRATFLGVVRVYMLPLGLWQYWGMFAPDPIRETLTLEAQVVDSQGLRHVFAFPTAGGVSFWEAVPRFRHPKFAANLAIPELELTRQYATRHAVRQLGLPAGAFPVDAHLIHQVVPAPPPGGPPADPMTAPRPVVIGSYRYESRSEVEP